MAFYIAQGISVLTVIFGVAAMQMKSMKKLLFCQLMSNLLAFSTYFLLGGFTGAGISVIAIVQSLVMYVFQRKERKTPLWVHILFLLCYIGCSALYYRQPTDLLSTAAALCFAVSIMQEKPVASRLWFFPNPLIWMAYDLCVRAYGNFVMHAMVFVSTALALVRTDRIFSPKSKK